MQKDLMMRVNREIERLVDATDFIVADGKPLKKASLFAMLYWISSNLGVPTMFIGKSKNAKYVPKGMFDLEGRYDSSEHNVQVTFIFNPEDKEELSPMKWVVWQYMKGMIFDVLSHEICHFYQDDKRRIRGVQSYQRMISQKEFSTIVKNDINETGLYLLNPDEIEAHAYNAASQMYRKYGGLNEALQALRCGKYCETIEYYREFIATDQKPYKRFIKKVMTFLVDKYSEIPEQPEDESTDHVDDNKE